MICLCKKCDCRTECGYYEETIEPVIKVVEANYGDRTDPFINQLCETLEKHTCTYFEGEKTE